MAVRVGLAGCGGIARAHWNGWAALGARVELVAIADPIDASRQWLLDRTPSAKAFDDWSAMMDAVDLDAVDICLPHDLHCPAVLSAIEHDYHWLCEKPLCTTLDDAARIERAMQNSSRIGMSAHNQVYWPAISEAKRMIDAGDLGKLYTVISQDCFLLGLPPAGSLPGQAPINPIRPGTWRADPKRMGGGELIDTGYHPTYRLLYLADGEPAHVAAAMGIYRHEHFQAEDTATVLVTFDNAVTGLIRTSWAMALPSGHHHFHVIGSRGELYGTWNRLWHKPIRFQEPAAITFEAVDSFVAEIAHFATCVETGATPITPFQDGIRALRLIQQAYADWRTHAT